MTKAKSGISGIGTTLTFLNGRACSDTLMCVLNRAFNHPLKLEEKAAMPFAGGIGLCGGACGALGAAIWINSMKSIEAQAGKIDFKDAKALDVIDRFLKSTDYEFECSEIAGRKFEDVGDHASYLREGGCSKIIEVLSA